MSNNIQQQIDNLGKRVKKLEFLVSQISQRRVNKSSTKSMSLKSGAINELISEGYLSNPRDNQEILSELGRRGVMVKPTSLPSLLLPLVRKKVLSRDHKEKNKRKVWVYKANE